MATNLVTVAPDLQATAAHLAGVKARLAPHYARLRESTPTEEVEWDELEEKRERLEQQFCAAFHALTGLRWSDAERIMNS